MERIKSILIICKFKELAKIAIILKTLGDYSQIICIWKLENLDDIIYSYSNQSIINRF